jgi:hypothetical protein
MKTPEDEAFDDIARRQGAWGGGYQAKRQAAMDKINSDFDEEYKKMHEDRIKYGTSWEKDGKHIDPMSVYKAQPAREPVENSFEEYCETLPPLWNTHISRTYAEQFFRAGQTAQPAREPEMLTIAYQSGYHDGKKAALAGREWNFCERCGKRTPDMTTIHTCTPPQEGK